MRSIVIKFTLENNSEENLWILKWNTPLEGLKKGFLTLYVMESNSDI